MIAFLKTIIYIPIYNLLVFIDGLLPGRDVGLALILVTLIVRVILLPLSLSAVKTQRAMRVIEPEIKEIREKYKDDQQKLATETFAIYKKYDVHPFSSVLLLFIQLPILFALYFMVRKESLYAVNMSILYPFIHAPVALSPLFLGIVLISKPSLVLAIITAITQYLQAYFAIPIPPRSNSTDKKSGGMSEDLNRAVAMQARYMFPIIFGIVAYTSGAIALYLITSNVFMLLQEVLVRTTIKPVTARS